MAIPPTATPLSAPRTGGRDFEARLDALREQARSTGTVDEASGMPIAGGPIPQPGARAGYYGQPIVKAPVWTWQIGLYFFVGGTAGMSGVFALAGLVTGEPLTFVRTALGVAFVGALLSPVLLVSDLGRPSRFLNMLRVFKARSAMSIGVWTLLIFSGFATSALALAASPLVISTVAASNAFRAVLFVMTAGTAIFGTVLATYTGVLLGATAVPVWSTHHRLLPFHFGMVALGSAAASLELLGMRLAALQAVGLSVSAIETGVGAWIEFTTRRRGGDALVHGESGLLLRASGISTGPVALALRLGGWVPVAAVTFLAGAVLSRYGWLDAGRASARDPEETLAVQRTVRT